jgi:hypothetical protein
MKGIVMKDKKTAVTIEQTTADPAQDSALAANTEAIARRAYELWEQRGCPHGCSQEDWFRAEAELCSGAAEHVPADS